MCSGLERHVRRHLARFSTTPRVADAETGAVRDVLEERSEPSSNQAKAASNWDYLTGTSNEAIGVRSATVSFTGQLLDDLATGKLKIELDIGPVAVMSVEGRRKGSTDHFLADGGKGTPYFSHLYRIGFDCKNLAPLRTPEEGNHQVEDVAFRLFFVDSYSKPEVPSVSVVRNESGNRYPRSKHEDISAR